MTTHAPHVVVVDPCFESYGSLIESARAGRISLHLRSSGEDALRIAERKGVDAWLVAADLDDMSGPDFVQLLRKTLERHEKPGLNRVAIVREVGAGHWEALEQGADCGFAKPISLSSLESFLDMTPAEREMILPSHDLARSLLALPIQIGAAVMAIAIVMVG
jgi:DNA-binding response OmpR family regulator